MVLAGLVEPLESPALDEPLPDWLLPHQADAVARARSILRRFGGVLVADGVGLGKTYIGLALAALERRSGGDAVAVVPAAVRDEWRRAGERVGVRLGAIGHTALWRAPAGDTRSATLVLVDEAHEFRNPLTRRYDALARLAVGRRLVLLTATPLNNDITDLDALLRLFAPEGRFRELGVADLGAAMRAGASGAALALGAVTVCRTRRLVEERFPALRARFPRRALAAPARYDLAAVYGGRLQELLAAVDDLDGSGGERAGALMRLGLLRRLESSRAAFRRTLLRHRDYLDELARAAGAGVAISRREFRASFPRTDEDDAQLVMWPLLKGPADPDALTVVHAWRAVIAHALALVAAGADAPDTKADALEQLLAGRPAGRKVIVFTEYRDTALDLLRRLRRRHRVAAVVGRDAWAGTTPLRRDEALDAFAPSGRRARADALLAADLLIATDVAGAGLNLQDADMVVNYDLPWNPVRLMQRIGRADRLGSPHQSVTLVHMRPANGLSDFTTVLRRLREKLAATGRTIGAEPDPMAALWWVEDGLPSPEAIERESWRRVAVFESRERWRQLAGPRRDDRGPVVAAGLVDDGGPPGAGVLLALSWRSGHRIPLPWVAVGGEPPRHDPEALAALAERAANAIPLHTDPSQLAGVLAAVLPEARGRLAELSAERHGRRPCGPGHRAALERLARASMELRAARADTARLAEAQELLERGITVGADRMLGDLLRRPGSTAGLIRALADLLARAATPAAPRLDGTPRLELVAAIVLAARCPAG